MTERIAKSHGYAELSAVIIRRDGTVEDRGVIARSRPDALSAPRVNPIRRLLRLMFERVF